MKRSMRHVVRCVAALLVVVGPAFALGGGIAGARTPVADAARQLEVVLVIDTSASMRPAVDATKAAATTFVNSMPAGVRIGLTTFGDVVAVATPPTTDRELLTQLIGGIVVDGDTALYDAVIASTQQFDPATEQKVIVLLSDGRDEGSLAGLDAAVGSLAGVTVEAISVTTEETDLSSLSALGSVTPADDAAGVAAAFARVAGLLAATVEPAAPTSSVAPTTTLPSTTLPATTIAPATTPATAGIAPSTPNTTVPAPASKVSTASRTSASLWLGAVATFLGLFVLILMLMPQTKVSKARLGIEQPRSVSDMGKRTVSAVEAALERRGTRDGYATKLSVADIAMRPGEFISSVAIGALICGLVGLLIGGPFGAVLVATLVCLGAITYVNRRKAKRQAAFAEQLPEVLQLLATALRSGFGLVQAIDSVAEEAEEPARSEFAQVLVEQRLGRDLSDAIRALARRMESDDLDWVVGAIDINRDVGGNLSEILTRVGATIRERHRMARQVATLTAEGRLSARILTAMPIVMGLWQWRANPESFAAMTRGGGLVALVIAGVLMVVGTFWVRRIVNSLAV